MPSSQGQWFRLLYQGGWSEGNGRVSIPWCHGQDLDTREHPMLIEQMAEENLKFTRW